MTSTSTAPTRRRALPALLAALALAGSALATLATLAAARYAGATCAEDAAHQPWSGQRALLGVVLAALLPWVLAASRTAPHTSTRFRLLVCAAVTASPPVLALLVGLDHDFWRAGLC
ncbi:MAG TPA: hypothetical protein VFP51_14140 [Nocardioidaceae bacterium]|nr:hypothetical protein [Nocardioidaceae bacterium]